MEPSAPPIPMPSRRGTLGQTLRDGVGAFGREVGGFFGLTDESQVGMYGWNEITQMRAEEGDLGFLTLSRRGSRRPSGPPPPDYNSLEPGRGEALRSFELVDVSDSDEEEEIETLFGEAPPDYFSLVAAPQDANVAYSPADARVSVYGHEDPTGAQRLPTLVPISEQQQQQQARPTAPAQEQRDDGLIRSPEAAYRYYLDYVRAEKAARQRRNQQNAGEFFGAGGRQSNGVQRNASTRRGRLGSVGEQQQPRARRGRNKLLRQNTIVRDKLASLPTFWPVFIIGITFAQVCVVVVLIALYGLAPINIFPQETTEAYPSLFNETTNATVTYYTFTNMWVGLDVVDLIHVGAKFSPCMHKDFAIINRNIQRRNMEADMGGLGCCRNNPWVGTTTLSGCVQDHAPSNTTAYLQQVPCANTTQLLENFHPCCISITGLCEVMHQHECTDRGGFFHSELDNCNQTSCMDDICGFGGIGKVDGDPLQPVGNQSWRLLLSLFIHLGVIHVVLLMVVQLYVGIKIERTAGFIRVLLIYIIAGTGGNLVSAIFIPYEVNAGASPAVFGLLGVLFVELFQSWQVVEKAWLELIKLSVCVLVLLAIGTLPFVDNIANIGGLMFGVPAAIIFLPYVTFGKWDAWRKRILLIICIPLLLVMYAACFFAFFFIRDPNFCPLCYYINCVPYTAGLCGIEYTNPDPDVFAL